MKPEPLTAREYSDRIIASAPGMFQMQWSALSIYRGWGPIVEEMVSTFVEVAKAHGVTVTVSDVKQKLGTLRVGVSCSREPTLWVTCDEPEYWAERSEGRYPVEGKMPANDFMVSRRVEAGDPVWKRTGGGEFVEAAAEAKRRHAASLLVHAAVEKAEAKAAATCEFCGEPGRIDKSNGYIAVACPDHSGDNQPFHRGDEFATNFDPTAIFR